MPRCMRPVAYGLPAVWGWALALGLTLTTVGPAKAQLDVLNELYGSGVHAYNSGAYREAYDDLSMAVRNGSKDPRVYYYRGLAYFKLGRPQEAHRDFQTGASLEMADTDRFYPVSKALERVQGQARAQIERYRSNARLVAYQSRERRRFERYERIRKNEPNVLMPEEATEIPSPAKEADEKPEAEKPDALEPKPEMADEEPADEKPAKKPAADDETDPFAEKPEQETDEKDAADEMPAEKEDDAAEEGADEKKPAEKVTEEGDEDMPADEKSDDEKSG
ncbi:MAG TPA: tetratricopeptide repeat protein [Pirellulales bacterium]|nr:tetratricopeptide repeat protein [Pirellulales bacterium]